MRVQPQGSKPLPQTPTGHARPLGCLLAEFERDLPASARVEREAFEAEIREVLSPDAAPPDVAERDWTALMARTPGVCLHEVTARGMVVKQRAVTTLSQLLAQYPDRRPFPR